MVLDAKAMGWGSEQGLDTAALKKAKLPIFGKWYFPDLPAGVPLVNLSTGQVETFEAGFRAGATLYVKEEDLRRARLGPFKAAPEPPVAPAAEPVVDSTTGSAAARTAGLGDAGPSGSPTADPATISGAQTRTADVRGPIERPPETQTTVAPSAVPTMDAVGEEEPVDMLHAPSAARSSGRATGEHGAAGHGAHASDVVHHANTHETAHPGPRTYITIAIILAVVTAVEVALYYIPGIPPGVLTAVLLVLSAGKFFLVAAYFMHLKFDHTSFTGYFGGGLAIAASIVLGLILLFAATPYGGGH